MNIPKDRFEGQQHKAVWELGSSGRGLHSTFLFGASQQQLPSRGRKKTEADFHNGGVPKADWKKRAMSGSDKSQLFVCTLLESHANEKKTSWQDTLIWSQSLSCEVDNPKERFAHTLFF